MGKIATRFLGGGDYNMMFKGIKKENEPTTPKAKRKISWKIKSGLGMAGLVVVFISAYLTLTGVNSFFEQNRFVFKPLIEVKFNQPISIEARPLVSPIATASAEVVKEEPKEESFNIIPDVEAAAASEVREIDYKTLAKFVHYRESGSGTAPKGHHTTCRSKGMWNEIGYAPQQGFCFADEAEGMGRLDRWLKENVQALGISKSLCKYNTGSALADCQYYQDYLAYTLQ